MNLAFECCYQLPYYHWLVKIKHVYHKLAEDFEERYSKGALWFLPCSNSIHFIHEMSTMWNNLSDCFHLKFLSLLQYQLLQCPEEMICKIERVRCRMPHCPDLYARSRPTCVEKPGYFGEFVFYGRINYPLKHQIGWYE